MTRFKIGPQTVISAVLALLLFSNLAWQSALAQVAPRLPDAPQGQPPASPAALSNTLSYYFISSDTFAPLGNFDFNVVTYGCIGAMPLNVNFTAPVHLPQASQVVSITLFTHDSVLTTTFSTAYFMVNDGQGAEGSYLSASSAPQVTGFQHHSNSTSNPATIDNQAYAYQVNWHKNGDEDSPTLGLCGVRLAYYAPVGATFLPTVEK
jgi:hypothetical protein